MAKYLDEAGLAKSFQLIKEYAVPKSGGTITGDLTVEGTTTVQTPVNDTDAATKAYVDTAVSNAGSSEAYTLPVASAETLGGIKVGNNLTITEDGTLSATASGGEAYTLPAATVATLGGVMVGSGLSITGEGVLSAEVTSSDLATVQTTASEAKTTAEAAQTTANEAKALAEAAGYTLPVATSSTLGGVMVGDGLSVTDAGVLSVSAKILTAEPTTSDLTEGEVAFVVEE